VEVADAGNYSVVVTGECGEVTSDVARLDVREPIGMLEIVLDMQPKDILLILDLSSSMEEPIAGTTKVDLAKDALRQLFDNLPTNTKVGLRTFHACGRSDLEVPIEPLSTGRLVRTVQALTTSGRTPLAYTLEQIPGDLQGLEGPHIVVFITDGAETCEGDPPAAARALIAAHPDVIFRLIGFDIGRSGGQRARDQLQAIADAAKGLYFDVETGEDLLDVVLGLILPPSYRVLDSDGQLVREGTVGDGPFELIAGTYAVEVGTDPAQVIENVTIEAETSATVEVSSD